MRGSVGEDVRALQGFLKEKEYFDYPDLTGYFGSVTKASAIAFQTAFGIDPIGIVGPRTRAKIAELCVPVPPASPVNPTPTSQSVAPPHEPLIPPTRVFDLGAGWTPGFGGGGTGVVAQSSTPAADTTAPSFSSISSGTPGTYSTTISWTTDESANSRMEYGTTTSYGTVVSESPFTTSHSVDVDGLIAGTLYHFRVSSTDASGNVASSTDQTFTAGLFSAGAKVTSVGDSIIQFANLATASTIENQADGELAWARFRAPRFRHDIWYDSTNTSANDRMGTYGDTTGTATGDILFSGANLGYAGDTATGILQRVTATKNTTADIILYSAGTNVGSTDSTAAATEASIESAVDSFRAAGKTVILGTIRPRRVAVSPSGTQISPASMDRIVEINDWIRANAERLGAVLWDPWDDLRDTAYGVNDDLYGTDASGVTRDNVHLTPYGAWLSSESLSTALNSVISSGTYFNTDPTVSNILTNGSFTGTGGTAQNGMTGTMPNNAFVSNSGGAGLPVTGTAAVEANADTGGQTIVLTATSTGAGTANTFNTIRLSFTNPSTGFTSTDYVSAFFEVEVASSTVRPAFQATLGQSSTISARGLGQVASAYNSQPYPTEDLNGWVATEPLLVGARTSLNPRLDIHIRTDAVGTSTVKIKRAILRTISDPTAAFPWSP